MASVEVVDTDITKLAVDTIANAANTELRHGGGVAGAIVRAGGRSIQDESDQKAPIALGDAVETSAGDRHLDAGSGLERVVFAVHGAAARAAFEQAVGS